MWNQFQKCENVFQMYRLAVQNTCGVKITKLANMLEEVEVFVKTWEGSIPQHVAIATVKAS